MDGGRQSLGKGMRHNVKKDNVKREEEEDYMCQKTVNIPTKHKYDLNII